MIIKANSFSKMEWTREWSWSRGRYWLSSRYFSDSWSLAASRSLVMFVSSIRSTCWSRDI